MNVALLHWARLLNWVCIQLLHMAGYIILQQHGKAGTTWWGKWQWNGALNFIIKVNNFSLWQLRKWSSLAGIIWIRGWLYWAKCPSLFECKKLLQPFILIQCPDKKQNNCVLSSRFLWPWFGLNSWLFATADHDIVLSFRNPQVSRAVWSADGDHTGRFCNLVFSIHGTRPKVLGTNQHSAKQLCHLCQQRTRHSISSVDQFSIPALTHLEELAL